MILAVSVNERLMPESHHLARHDHMTLAHEVHEWADCFYSGVVEQTTAQVIESFDINLCIGTHRLVDRCP